MLLLLIGSREGLTFASASDNGVWDPVKRTVTWTVDLAKGESKVFSVIATVVRLWKCY